MSSYSSGLFAWQVEAKIVAVHVACSMNLRFTRSLVGGIARGTVDGEGCSNLIAR